jgi:HAMP domain-containing protein
VKINFNSEEFKKSMDEVRKINMKEITEELKKVKIEFEKNKNQIKIDIQGAKDEIKKASASLREIKEMTDEMEKDKLLNKKEGYTIEYKNQELFINGKKQSKEVSGKYRKYFKGEDFKLERKKEN